MQLPTTPAASEPLYAQLDFWALLVALLSFVVSAWAVSVSKKAARRTGVIDLSAAWGTVNEIDPKQLIAGDVKAAVNALDLTASLWNHDVMEKQILFQSYWQPFKALYETLANIDTVVPGYRKTGRECLTANVTKAYQDMQQLELKMIKQTRL